MSQQKSGVPMDMPPAGQKSPKKHGFPWTCLRRVKNPKQIRGSHGHASGGSKIPKKSGVPMDMPPAGQKSQKNTSLDLLWFNSPI